MIKNLNKKHLVRWGKKFLDRGGATEAFNRERKNNNNIYCVHQ